MYEFLVDIQTRLPIKRLAAHIAVETILSSVMEHMCS